MERRDISRTRNDVHKSREGIRPMRSPSKSFLLNLILCYYAVLMLNYNQFSAMRDERYQYSPIVSYDSYLRKFAEEFNDKWNQNAPSPENGMEGYEERATLGAGAFGRVVI